MSGDRRAGDGADADADHAAKSITGVMDAGVQRQSPQAAAALGAILSTGRLTGANGGGETGVCRSRSSARRGARMAARYCSTLEACLQ